MDNSNYGEFLRAELKEVLKIKDDLDSKLLEINEGRARLRALCECFENEISRLPVQLEFPKGNKSK